MIVLDSDRDFYPSRILVPRVKRALDPGCGMNIQDHNSECLVKIFWNKNVVPDRGSFRPSIGDTGSGIEKFGTGVNIQDLQHWEN
jgi:hypothetical protein